MEKYRIEASCSYSLGMSLTIEALKQRPEHVRQVLLSSKANKNQQLSSLLELCDRHSIPYVYDDKSIDKLSNKENCYCIGVIDKYETALKGKRHVVLYGFHDYGDLGTVLRSAVAFDFSDIVLIDSDIDIFDPRCIRASMGSLFHCDFARYKDFDSYRKDYDYKLYPFVSDSDKELSDIEFEEPYALVIGRDYKQLDELFEDGICIDHKKDKEISLSIRSSIILQRAYQSKRVR